MDKQSEKQNAAPVWLTVVQLETKLQVSRSTIYRWMNREVIRAYRFDHSRIIYFRESEIDEFLSNNPITPTGRLDKTCMIQFQI